MIIKKLKRRHNFPTKYNLAGYDTFVFATALERIVPAAKSKDIPLIEFTITGKEIFSKMDYNRKTPRYSVLGVYYFIEKKNKHLVKELLY